MDPCPWLEGPYKIGSVCLSICPSSHMSVSFLRIDLLVFSETWHGVRGPYIVVWDRARFFWKKSPLGKNDQKLPKNKVFGLFKKIASLVLLGICVKWKFLWFINILQKLHAKEKSGSKLSKMALGQWDFSILELSIFY